ncbi:uroporphyrinogen decarboxylase family protein [Chloroflexota bacterium]
MLEVVTMDGMKPEEKMEKLFEAWLSPQGAEFKNPEAEKDYRDRVKRLSDALRLKVPDRVPVYTNIGFYPAYAAGITAEEVVHDYNKLTSAWQKNILENKPDTYGGSGTPGPGKAYGILDYKLYLLPGHGAAPDSPYQYVEGVYMTADEYDDLIDDPSDFMMRTFIPRIFGKLEPFAKISPANMTLELPFTSVYMTGWGTPEIRSALEALMAAGEEAIKWRQAVTACDNEIRANGFPLFSGGYSKAPFDVLSDTLRGTRELSLDLYRQPEKVIEAMERLVPLMIKMGVAAAKASGRPLVTLPLHKGADGFMSEEQFLEFYWPTLKKVILGLIDEGVFPFLFAEGGYETRLEIIKDLPEGRTAWHFDFTDMAKAKEALGKTACIIGNVPLSLLNTATTDEVRQYCKQLIDVAGKGGGFILASGGVIDKAKPENIRTMIDFSKEYGVYS